MSHTPADAPAETAQDAPTPAAPPPPPPSWAEPEPGRPLPFWSLLREDLMAQVPAELRDRSALGWARVILGSRSLRVSFSYRLNHVLRLRGGAVGKVLAGIINWVVHHLYFCAISPGARIYGGLVLPHPQGVIIGPDVVIGPRAWVFQHVTIGAGGPKDGVPTIGADCRIYSGAVLVGPIVVGDEVAVSPNTLVQRNVPDRSLIVGVPGNVFPRFAFAKPKA